MIRTFMMVRAVVWYGVGMGVLCTPPVWAATYNFYFNNVEQGERSLAYPKLVVGQGGAVLAKETGTVEDAAEIRMRVGPNAILKLFLNKIVQIRRVRTFIHNLQVLDLRFFGQVFGWSQEGCWARALNLTSRSADGYFYPVVVAAMCLADADRLPLILGSGSIAFALDLPVYKWIKARVRRSRPFEQLKWVRSRMGAPDEFSFPSGHTASAVVMATHLSYFFPVFTPAAFCWAAMVGLSRVYLGVHYPSDVFAGGFLGLTSALVGIFVGLQLF